MTSSDNTMHPIISELPLEGGFFNCSFTQGIFKLYVTVILDFLLDNLVSKKKEEKKR